MYVAQTDTVFGASVDFLIKQAPAEGLYTIMLGGDNNVVSETFYIGVNDAGYAGDAKMDRLATGGESTNADGTKNYGYTKTVSNKTDFNSVIIKSGDKYMGIAISTLTSGDGDTVMGIQINNVPESETIDGVWLSTRTITDNGDGQTVTATK